MADLSVNFAGIKVAGTMLPEPPEAQVNKNPHSHIPYSHDRYFAKRTTN